MPASYRGPALLLLLILALEQSAEGDASLVGWKAQPRKTLRLSEESERDSTLGAGRAVSRDSSHWSSRRLLQKPAAAVKLALTRTLILKVMPPLLNCALPGLPPLLTHPACSIHHP